MTLIAWDTFKELFELIKFFCDFIARMGGCAKTRLYGVLWKVLPLIYKLVEEYKRHLAYYMTLAMSNQYIKSSENRADMEVNYILIFIKNVLIGQIA